MRRPCPRELFIKSYRLGQFDDALGILKKIDREITEQVIGHLSTTDEGNSMDWAAQCSLPVSSAAHCSSAPACASRGKPRMGVDSFFRRRPAFLGATVFP